MLPAQLILLYLTYGIEICGNHYKGSPAQVCMCPYVKHLQI